MERTVNRWWALVLLALGALLTSSPALAYFEIELRDGGKVLADSYRIDGQRLFVYRDGISLDLDRDNVKAIQERSGETARRDSSAAVVDTSTIPSGSPARPELKPKGAIANAVTAVPTKTPTVLENELTRKLIIANRDLLFAQNRGEDDESLRKRKEEIEKLQKDRDELRKQLKR